MRYGNLPDELKEKIAYYLKSEKKMNTIKARATFGATNLESYKLKPVQKSRWDARIHKVSKDLSKEVLNLNDYINELLSDMSKVKKSNQTLYPHDVKVIKNGFNNIVKRHELIEKRALKLSRAINTRTKLKDNLTSNNDTVSQSLVNNASKLLRSLKNHNLKYNNLISKYLKWVKEGRSIMSQSSKGGRGSSKGGKGGQRKN